MAGRGVDRGSIAHFLRFKKNIILNPTLIDIFAVFVYQNKLLVKTKVIAYQTLKCILYL